MPFRRAALVIATLFSACVAAAPMRIALHPLLVVGGEGTETASLQALFVSKVIALGGEPVPSDEVTRWLSAHGNHCVNDACLAALAKATGASRALQVSISPYSPRVILSGRLISQSGAVLADIDAKSFPRRQSLADDFQSFLHDLDLDAPEPAPLVAAPVPAPSTPAPVKPAAPPMLSPTQAPPVAASSALPAPSNHSTLRLASYVVAGAGVAALAIAGGVALAAKGDRNKFDALLDPTGARPPTSEAADLDASLTSRSHLVNGLLVGGGAAFIGGAVMWWFSRPAPVQLSLAPAGTGLAVAGTF